MNKKNGQQDTYRVKTNWSSDHYGGKLVISHCTNKILQSNVNCGKNFWECPIVELMEFDSPYFDWPSGYFIFKCWKPRLWRRRAVVSPVVGEDGLQLPVAGQLLEWGQGEHPWYLNTCQACQAIQCCYIKGAMFTFSSQNIGDSFEVYSKCLIFTSKCIQQFEGRQTSLLKTAVISCFSALVSQYYECHPQKKRRHHWFDKGKPAGLQELWSRLGTWRVCVGWWGLWWWAWPATCECNVGGNMKCLGCK